MVKRCAACHGPELSVQELNHDYPGMTPPAAAPFLYRLAPLFGGRVYESVLAPQRGEFCRDLH